MGLFGRHSRRTCRQRKQPMELVCIQLGKYHQQCTIAVDRKNTSFYQDREEIRLKSSNHDPEISHESLRQSDR